MTLEWPQMTSEDKGHEREWPKFNIPCISYVMVYGRIWLLGLYFELFPHNNNCYQGLTCAGAAGKKNNKKKEVSHSKNFSWKTQKKDINLLGENLPFAQCLFEWLSNKIVWVQILSTYWGMLGKVPTSL